MKALLERYVKVIGYMVERNRCLSTAGKIEELLD